MSKALFFDIESHSVDDRYDMEPREFVRLFQYAWGREGEVHTTTDYDEALSLIRAADRVIGWNIISFDLPALFGKDSLEPLEMALNRKVIDGMVLAHLRNPAPYSFTTRGGHTFYDGQKPEKAMRWLSLDNQAHVFGVDGKIGDLKAMAKEFGGFGNIPVDHPEFVEYAVQDIVALQQIMVNLLDMGPMTEYEYREFAITAINAQISSNGWLVDAEAATSRVEELRAKRDEIMTWLVDKYDFPTDGKSPWASAKGKEVIFQALADYGITPETHPDWEKTATGNPSLGGQALIDLTAGTEAKDLGKALAELKGQRSLAQLALDSRHADGRAHPEITSFQRSGRFSITKPGLTVWTARGPGAVEKKYFIADPGCKLLELDYSAADARAVAAVSGDVNYKERFEPGVDSHELTGRIVFGDETYDSDAKHYRQVAKMLGHAYAYRAGPKKLSASSGQPLEVAQQFVDEMKRAYPYVAKWQERVTDEAESGFVTNWWGRRMVIDAPWDERRKRHVSRGYTQGPALIGQSTTREILTDGLLKMVRERIDTVRWLRATVHDAVVFNIPDEDAHWAPAWIKSKMESTFDPGGSFGQAIDFPVETGTLSSNWYEAGH